MGSADTANLKEYACFCPFAVGGVCPLKKEEINSYKSKFGNSHCFSPLPPPPIYEKFFTAWLLDIPFHLNLSPISNSVSGHGWREQGGLGRVFKKLPLPLYFPPNPKLKIIAFVLYPNCRCGSVVECFAYLTNKQKDLSCALTH